MKKILAILLTVVILASALMLSVCALPLKKQDGTMNTEALNALFIDWEADSTHDGVVYSPVKEDVDDDNKYPVFVWIHGMNSGKEPRAQLNGYEISNWASDEYQAKFGDLGGCFVFAPRASFSTNDWNPKFTGELMYDIQYMITEYKNNVDTSRIYIGGYSTGAEIIWDMLISYPQFFAAAIIAAPVQQPTDLLNDATLSKICNIPIWVISSDNDYHPGAQTKEIEPIFTRMATLSQNPQNLRLTTVSEARYANGKVKGDGKGGVASDWTHYVWECVTYDMHMEDGVTPYVYCTTRNGVGESVTFEDPNNGFISWLVQYKIEGERNTENVGQTTCDKIAEAFRNFFNSIKALFESLFSCISNMSK